MDAEKAFVTLTVLSILNKAQAFLPFSIHSVVQVRLGEGRPLGGALPGCSRLGPVSTHLPSADSGRMERGSEKELAKQGGKHTKLPREPSSAQAREPHGHPRARARSASLSHEAAGSHVSSLNTLCARAASSDAANVSGHSPS